MSLTLAEVLRIAREVAAQENDELAVAVTRSEGDSAYAELIITVINCAVEPCRGLIGIDRNITEAQFRTACQNEWRQHLQD